MMDIIERLRMAEQALPQHLASTGLYAGTAKQAADEIKKLREQLAACQADAERYRWLKRYRTRERYSGELLIEFECDFDNYNNLDAAIDAAMDGK